MTRKLILDALVALVAALGSTPFPSAVRAEGPAATTQLASTELNSLSLATSTPVTSLSLFDERSDSGPTPPLLQAEIELRPEAFPIRSSHAQDAAEHWGNWLVVAGFGLSFTVGLIITIGVTRPTTKLPRPVFD